MTSFLGTEPAPTGLPPMERKPSSFGERVNAGIEAERIETGGWSPEKDIEDDLLSELEEELGIGPDLSGFRANEVHRQIEIKGLPESEAELLFGKAGLQTVQGRKWRRARVLEASEAARAAGGDVRITSQEDIERLILERRRADLDEAIAVLGAGPEGAWFAETLGRLYAGATDPTTLATLPLGFGAGSIGRVVLAETALGAGSEALMLPRQYQVAEDLDLPEPNALAQVGIAGLTGGVLGGGIYALATGATRWRRYRKAREAAAVEQAGSDGFIESERQVAEAQRDLENDRENPARSLPGAPPDWERIKAGIFAGESGGDYDALFSFSNRPGGPFQHVKLTEMTVDEAIAFSAPRGAYGQWVKGKINRIATPMGAYQIVGTTLRAAKKGLRLRGTEIMTPELQDRLGLWIYHQQGTGAWVGYRGPRTPGKTSASSEPPPEYTPYRTSRGYTNEGQVAWGDGGRIDVEYEVVDASLLRQAEGDLQPRDRARASSDAWVAETAARLDPARLMPAPTADRGTPIVGPDNVIESGNGRVQAITRAYEVAPDRTAAYREQIEATTGEPIPEGIDQPVLIARRISELDEASRRSFVQEAQDSGVARMTATERARIGQERLNADRMAKFVPGKRLSSPENRDFARDFIAGFPRSERNAFAGKDGQLSQDGIRQIQDSLFARAWDAEDLIAQRTEAEPGDARQLLQALDDAAPAFAQLRAEIDAGLIRPEFDISGYVIDAVRLITTARDIATKEGGKIAEQLDALLSDVDLFGASVAPLTQALVRKFYPGTRVASADKIGKFLTRYAEEARKAGRVADALAGDPPGVLDVLKGIDKGTFGDLTALGTREIDVMSAQSSGGLPEFAEGASSPDAQAADDLLREELDEGPFGPVIRGFRDDPEGAISTLVSRQNGEVADAVVHPELGDIAFVWGRSDADAPGKQSGFGIKHILEDHSQETLDRVPDLLRNGRVVRRDDRPANVFILDDATPANVGVMRLDWDGRSKTWLVTSFADERGDFARHQKEAYRTDAGDERVPSSSGRSEDTPSDPAFQGDELRRLIDETEARDIVIAVENGPELRIREVLDDLDADDDMLAAVEACTLGRSS